MKEKKIIEYFFTNINMYSLTIKLDLVNFGGSP